MQIIEYSGPGSTFEAVVYAWFDDPPRSNPINHVTVVPGAVLGGPPVLHPKVPAIPSMEIDMFFREIGGAPVPTEFSVGIHNILYNPYIDHQVYLEEEHVRPAGSRVMDIASLQEPVVIQPEYAYQDPVTGIIPPIPYTRPTDNWWNFGLGPAFMGFQTPVKPWYIDNGGGGFPPLYHMTPATGFVNPFGPVTNMTLLDTPMTTKGAGQPYISQGWGAGGLANQVFGPFWRQARQFPISVTFGIKERFWKVLDPVTGGFRSIQLNVPKIDHQWQPVLNREAFTEPFWDPSSIVESHGNAWTAELANKCPGGLCTWTDPIDPDNCGGDEPATYLDIGRSASKMFIARTTELDEMLNTYTACACDCEADRATGTVRMDEDCPRNDEGECMGGKMFVDDKGNCLKWEDVEERVPKAFVCLRPDELQMKRCGHGPDPDNPSTTHTYALDAAGNPDDDHNPTVPKYKHGDYVTVEKLGKPVIISTNVAVVSSVLLAGAKDDIIGIKWFDDLGLCGADGCHTWAVTASYRDINVEARSKSSAGGAGGGGGMNKECVTLCKDGKEETGFILFEPSDCLGGAAVGGGGGGGGAAGGGAAAADGSGAGGGGAGGGGAGGGAAAYQLTANNSISKCTECNNWEEKGYLTKVDCLEDYCNAGTNPNCCNQ
jgi:hypothetical protein